MTVLYKVLGAMLVHGIFTFTQFIYLGNLVRKSVIKISYKDHILVMTLLAQNLRSNGSAVRAQTN